MNIQNSEPPPVNGNFVRRGTFLAIPLCFPGVSKPVPLEESRISKVCLSPDSTAIYSFSRGPGARMFQTLPLADYGYTAGIRLPSGVTEVLAAAVLKGQEWDHVVFSAVIAGQTRLFHTREILMGTGIQEWHTVSSPVREFALDRPHGLLDFVASRDGNTFASIDSKELLLFSLEKKSFVLSHTISLPSCGAYPRFFPTQDGIFLLRNDGRLLRFNLSETQSFSEVEALDFPFPISSVATAFASRSDIVFCSNNGETIVFDSVSGRYREMSTIPLLPVRGVAQTLDGRIFASAGEEICHLFEISHKEKHPWAKDLGVPASTLSTRRYGLQLTEVLCGNNGELYFCEDDRGGHLWVYFPAISSCHEMTGASFHNDSKS